VTVQSATGIVAVRVISGRNQHELWLVGIDQRDDDVLDDRNPDLITGSGAGGSERAATKLVDTYAGALDERRFDEIDAALQGRLPTPFGVLLVGKAAHVSERETLTQGTNRSKPRDGPQFITERAPAIPTRLGLIRCPVLMHGSPNSSIFSPTQHDGCFRSPATATNHKARRWKPLSCFSTQAV
jgi:hypothetical protein